MCIYIYIYTHVYIYIYIYIYIYTYDVILCYVMSIVSCHIISCFVSCCYIDIVVVIEPSSGLRDITSQNKNSTANNIRFMQHVSLSTHETCRSDASERRQDAICTSE